MKTILSIIALLALALSTASAGITELHYAKRTEGGATKIYASAWGLDLNGKQSNFEFTSDSDLQKFDDFETLIHAPPCSNVILQFSQDGSLFKADFNAILASKSKCVDHPGDGCKDKAATLKSFIEISTPIAPPPR